VSTSEKILLVDDDPYLLEASERLLKRRFSIELGRGPQEGLAAIDERGPFAVVVSDMRMPGMDGVTFLSQVKTKLPDSIRIMLTAYPELRTAMDAVNQGNIYRFLTKPCSSEDLALVLEAGLEQYRLLRVRQEVLETKLRHAQNMEVVGQCAAGAAHDLRNILTIIQMRADVALQREPAHSKLADSLRQIHSAALHAANLTQQLTSMSRRPEKSRFEEVDVQRLLAELCEMFGHVLPRSILVKLDCPAGLDPVHGDAGMLRQVIVNLVLNARDAMPDGGELVIRAEVRHLDAPVGGRPRRLPRGRFVCLSVSDTGCGMDATTQKRIFEPFFTTKDEEKGTGLGLSVVADIVQQHHGRIEVISQPGQGSTFEVLLPARPPAPADLTSTP
jgi:signal transduction histidine kinase